ncbi:MAG: pyridoxal phosphate-dependent decarboxylase family protein [Steroidobacteraceae bacterium]
MISELIQLLKSFAVRSDHPRYFGLFNPPALLPAIAGDLVAAAINPQLAVWSHAPAAAEIERKLIRLFGSFLWCDVEAAGTFTSGGSEANHTALLAALASRYPNWHRDGIQPQARRPLIYASAESHLAWIKIARMCGLGSEAVRLVPTEDGLRITGEALAQAIAADDGCTPVLVVATAGTTAHGAIDDLSGIARVGRDHGAHIHVDAAWAGGALLHAGYRHLFAGIDNADSVTIDPHKWLAVPMGAGLFLARDWTPLAQAFAVSTGYMPSASSERHDAYIHSVQWSRRFIGARLFAALATLGLDGYRALIDRSFGFGTQLRARLHAEHWQVVNRTDLPLVCFAPADADDERVRAIEQAVVTSGVAWISTVRLRGRLVLRACITSYETQTSDLDALVEVLARARAA